MKGCRSLKKSEIKEMLKNANVRDRILFLTGLTFGLRISESLELRFGDVKGKYVSIKSLKHSENASFPVPSEYREAIKQLRRFYTVKGVKVTDKTPLFLGNKGWNKTISRQAASQMVRRLSAKLGIDGKVNTHSLRKSFVAKVYELSGKDIVLTKQYSRHKSLSSLDYYLGTTVEKDLVNQLGWGS